MNQTFEIKKAVRKASPVSVFIEGESGSGKTYSALLLARGLAGPNGKIGLIDSEGGRSLIYADDPQIGGFEHMDFQAPYSPSRFIEAMQAAVADGWDAIIIDSASLEHDGEGGLIEMAEAEAGSGKNSMQKWIVPKRQHKKFLNHAVSLPAHVIMCFRQTITTDFSSNPPKQMLTCVAEKNTRFALEMHCLIRADHTAHWTRVPKPYVPCIGQDELISVETGAKLANESGGTETAKKPSSADEVARCVQEANSWFQSQGITVDQVNAVFSTKETTITDWRSELSDDKILKFGDAANLDKIKSMIV